MNNKKFVEDLKDGNRETLLLIENWSFQIASSKFYTIPVEHRKDIVQDVLLQIYEMANSPNFQIKVSMKALVRKITISRCIDWIRKQRPTVQDFEQYLVDNNNPYKDVIDKENKNIIHWALMSLKQSCKTIIKKHFFNEVSYSEIAKNENISVSTVRVKMHRCINKLRKFFYDNEVER